jgi:hypothetical protein
MGVAEKADGDLASTCAGRGKAEVPARHQQRNLFCFLLKYDQWRHH